MSEREKLREALLVLCTDADAALDARRMKPDFRAGIYYAVGEIEAALSADATKLPQPITDETLHHGPFPPDSIPSSVNAAKGMETASNMNEHGPFPPEGGATVTPTSAVAHESGEHRADSKAIRDALEAQHLSIDGRELNIVMGVISARERLRRRELERLRDKWRSEVIKWHDAGFFQRCDTFQDCTDELTALLEGK